jgi:hypothetical protein
MDMNLGLELVINSIQQINITEQSVISQEFSMSVEGILEKINNENFIRDVCTYGAKGLEVNLERIIDIYGPEIGRKLCKYNTKVIQLYNYCYCVINPEEPLNTLDPKTCYDHICMKFNQIVKSKLKLIAICNESQVEIANSVNKTGDSKSVINTTSLIPFNERGCIVSAKYINNIRINEFYSHSTFDLNLHLDWNSGSEWGSDEDPDSYRIDSNRPR